jgi:hypothetical protein
MPPPPRQARRTAWPFARLLLVAGLLSTPARAQQIPDTDFKPLVKQPTFASGAGPAVLIDEAHANFHTASERYQPFADLLRWDGYVVTGSTLPFDTAALARGAVLVIANATGARNRPPFAAPVEPAFSDGEVAAVRGWVERGGALLLIVDHFPWPDAARPLAEAFGLHFHRGIANEPGPPGPLVFRRSDHSLAEHAITRGRNAGEGVDSIATFTGSAFQVDRGEPLLTFVNPQAFAVTPTVLGRPSKDDPRTPIQGWLQAAALRVGTGRVVVFGEAALFSAQLAGPARAPMGMNHPLARQNPQLVLNVMHWLAGVLDPVAQPRAAPEPLHRTPDGPAQ